jgi:hypothetical protein
MNLNLPIWERVESCKNLLIAGMGGGFDIFCGLPIYFELRERGMNVHLANYSFSHIAVLREGVRLSKTLVGVNTDVNVRAPYFPEQHLAHWFQQSQGEQVTVWCFEKTGAAPLLENYQALVEHLGIDGILLIDGGVDSLFRGDEFEVGTLIEDTISLAAVSKLDNVPTRIVACTAFGAEQSMSYAHVFENMAALAKLDAFLGSCSLVKSMKVYQRYEEAVLYVQSRPVQDSSVINSSLISAVQGHYGNFHLTEKTLGSILWISPLMPIYWFYDLQAVAERNLLIEAFLPTETFMEAWRHVFKIRLQLPQRSRSRIPLP